MPSFSKIIPHLWFDTQAKESAEFYCSIFPNSKITDITVLQNTPSGDCDVVSFELAGQQFMSISAGPIFKINPSISFFVNFDPSKDPKARENLDATWSKLSEGGQALMALDEYPFSKRYGWIQDKYGVSWQLILADPTGEERPFIVPSLLFTGDVSGKAREATNYYISIFKDSKRGALAEYPEGMEPDKPGTLMYSDFTLNGQWFAAMDSAHDHKFGFNEAVSLLINCDTQEEIDYFWQKLSTVPEAEQCGWCKDKWGVSWQVSPTILGELMTKGTQEQVNRVTAAFMPMKKLEIEPLIAAYNG